MKKIIIFLLAVVIFVLCAACGENRQGGSESGDVYFLSEFVLPDAEYGEFYKFDLKSVKVLDENGKTVDKTVGIDSIIWPSGKKTKLAGTSVKLNEVGQYTVNYIVKGTDQIFEKTLFCKDTQGPVISLGENIFIPERAVIGQRVILPEGTASDLSGVEGEVTYSILDPSGQEVAAEAGGRFTAKTAGDYLVTYSAKDKNGNGGTRKITVNVADIEAEPDVIGYTHLPYGVVQNDGMYRHEEYIKELFVEDVTLEKKDVSTGIEITAGGIPAMPNGEVSATLITPSDDVQRVTYCVNSAIGDLSGYDYVGMWVYNQSPRNMRLSLNYRGANEYSISPGQWNYVAFNLNAYDYSDSVLSGYNDTGAPVIQPLDKIRKVTFRFDYEWDESDYFPDDSYGYRQKGYADLGFNVYIGKITAGKFTDETVAEYDKAYGSAFYTDYCTAEFPVVCDSSFSYSKNIGESGSEGCTIVTSLAQVQELPLHMYMFKNVNVGENYTVWLKNPNTYSVIFNDGKGNSITLGAGEEGRYPITVYASDLKEWKGAGLYDASLSLADGALPEGTALCIGSVKKI